MSKAQLVITAVVLEGRSKSEVARDYDVSRKWVQQLSGATRPRAAAFEPRSRRPHHNRASIPRSKTRSCDCVRHWTKQGYDAGAATIAEHLGRDLGVAKVPAVSTIWRILSRRGFVAPQPQKRPRRPGNASSRTTQSMLASRCHPLAPRRSHRSRDPRPHRRPLPPRPRQPRPTCHDRPRCRRHVHAAFARWGTPAGVLTDNGAIFTAKQRGHGWRCAS